MRVHVTASRDRAHGSRHRYICHAYTCIHRMFGLILNDYLAMDCALGGLWHCAVTADKHTCVSLCFTVLGNDAIEWIRKTTGVCKC